jgi:hypothetical protein
MVLRLQPEARLDLEAAVRWYEAQEKGAIALALFVRAACFLKLQALTYGSLEYLRTP